MVFGISLLIVHSFILSKWCESCKKGMGFVFQVFILDDFLVLYLYFCGILSLFIQVLCPHLLKL